MGKLIFKNESDNFIYCIKCGAKITIDYVSDGDFCMDKLWDAHESIDYIGAIGGFANRVVVNFGSTHDGDIIMFGLCDSCIDGGIEDGSVLYIENSHFMGSVDEQVKLSKKTFKRRQKLDIITDEYLGEDTNK
jgi:hypothetical protein